MSMPDKLQSTTIHDLSTETRTMLNEILLKYLETLGKERYFDDLSYIMNEIVGNAQKANIKRVHFIKKGLDITSDADYKKGITDFKAEMSEHTDEYFALAKENGLFARIDLFQENNSFVMSVYNNSGVVPEEKVRIQNKLRNAMKFKTMQDAITQGLDTTEGGGFGLTIILLMIRKFGLDDQTFRINPEPTETTTSIHFPINLLNKEESDFIAESVVNEIKDIPQFPPNIMKILNMLSDENTTFEAISEVISRDPALIADLLKVANSTMYMLPKKVETINEAVRLLGLKAIYDLVMTHTTSNIMVGKYSKEMIQGVIDHSKEVAFYAYEMARTLKLKGDIDNTFVAAMLHDFGKIIIYALEPDLVNKLQEICVEKGINNFIVESLTNGYNHSIIGAKLAEKWNFPEFLIETIKYHHIPLESSDEHKQLTYLVYLANKLYYYRRGETTFDTINYLVLDNFSLSKRDQFDSFTKPIVAKYKDRASM
jgi:putative nucleotidyltransferase with HDIG domain